MGTARAALGLLFDGHTTWSDEWIWGRPLIVLTVIIHVLGIGYISQKAILIYGDVMKHRHPTAAFAGVVGATALLATVLHAFETGIWAIAYVFVWAMPDFSPAMLYSMVALPTYRHPT